ncbi:MAG TPA: hypothetical protein DD434_02135, partial [Bacteroidales bacterium]|nr:hypothetical protein [Bacteroidales bacterium]
MPKAECPGKKSLDTGLPYKNIEIGFQTNDGIKWIIINSELFNIKGYGVYLTLHDITQDKKKTEELRIFNQYFSTFLNNISDYIYFIDKEEKVLFCSQSFALLNRKTTWKNLVGEVVTDILPAGTIDEYIKDDAVIKSTGESIIGKIIRHVNSKGKNIYLQTSKWPIFNDKDEVIGIIGISRDISELAEE